MTSAAVLVKEAAMKSYPSLIPKRISSWSFRADKWHIYLYARKVYTFFVAEDTTIYNGTDNVMTFDLFDFKSDQTIIDQNAVARFDIFI